MRHIYSLFLLILLPFFIVKILLRDTKSPKRLANIKERLGGFNAFAIDSSIWIHAVSVGEVQAAQPMVIQLRKTYPDIPIVITTTTYTGSERVIKLFGNSVHHVYFPYDLPFAIKGFMKRVKPRLLVMMETEIWPNLLEICARKGIPTVLANARLSEKSALGYSRLGSFTRETFGNISIVAAQAPADAQRFLGLGVPSNRVRVTGSIKFDIRMPATLHEQAEVLRREWGERPVWVAASTHEGEDEQILAAHGIIRQGLPDALLVLVPRHPERFERVAELCLKRRFSIARRSLRQISDTHTDIFLGDTMGELTLFLAAADVAFVGGSLVPTGGHNVLEPAALGVPVVFGPHMFNFSIISSMLLSHEAAEQVADEVQMGSIVSRWLSDASERARIGENGRSVVEANRGALDRLMTIIEEQLHSGRD